MEAALRAHEAAVFQLKRQCSHAGEDRRSPSPLHSEQRHCPREDAAVDESVGRVSGLTLTSYGVPLAGWDFVRELPYPRFEGFFVFFQNLISQGQWVEGGIVHRPHPVCLCYRPQ